MGMRWRGGSHLRTWVQHSGWQESEFAATAVTGLLAQWRNPLATQPVQVAAGGEVDTRQVVLFQLQAGSLKRGRPTGEVVGLWVQVRGRHPGIRLGPAGDLVAMMQGEQKLPGFELPVTRLHGVTREGALPKAVIGPLQALQAALPKDGRHDWQVEWRERDLVVLVAAPQIDRTVPAALSEAGMALVKA